MDPLPGPHTVAGRVAGHPTWRSRAFSGQVARRADRTAVMSYDTATPLESLYGGDVAERTAPALEAAPPGTDPLRGRPFHRERTPSRWGFGEAARATAQGVRLGPGRTDRDRARFGDALYVDFTAREGDRAAYRAERAR